MHALHIFILTIAVFLLVDALPHEKRSKVITIPLKRKVITRRAHNVSRISKRAIQNIEVQQQEDISYFAEVTFGNQNVDVQLDTGSGDLFVTSIDCESPACEMKNKYDPAADESYVDLDEDFSADYDKGSVTGTSGTCDYTIGDFTVDAQDFGLALTLSDDFARDEFDGIMGMGLSSLSENNQLTPITRLIQNGDLNNPQFSFKLGRDADGTASELTIGGTNPESFVGEINWSDLSEDNGGFWMIPLDDCLVNGQALNFQDRDGNIDTGSTRINIPLADAQAVYALIPNSEEMDDGRFSIPCESQNIISLRFNGLTWNMDPRDFIIQEDEDECYGAIDGVDTGSDTEWIIGCAFLKNVYSVFDQEQLQVGFAQLA